MTKQRINRIKKLIVKSRTRLLFEHPFYALMLMHLSFVSDTKIWSISTDGKAIYFNPDFLEKLPTDELDFILCHQVMHILFEDIWRSPELKSNTYHHACDIVINSHLLDDVLQTDKLRKLGEIYHLFQKEYYFCEGKHFTADEVYSCLPYTVPHYDEVLKNGKMTDNDKWWGNLKIPENDKTLTVIIDGDAEDTLAVRAVKKESSSDPQNKNGSQTTAGEGNESECRKEWKNRASAAIDIISQFPLSGEKAGNVPAFLKRLVGDLQKPKTDWKKVLNDFIQEEVCDYSFSPPDRRFDGCDFFLPDFNEKDTFIRRVLFMVDTSASITDKMISLAYSEIYGAVSQYNGKLRGEIGFFDVEVTKPIPFETVSDVLEIIPYGGGGTDFIALFDYISKNCSADPPSVVIIFTDGEAYYPEESAAMGIPVLWMINNYDVDPPWGKVVRCVAD